jgi:hypothetical protein
MAHPQAPEQIASGQVGSKKKRKLFPYIKLIFFSLFFHRPPLLQLHRQDSASFQANPDIKLLALANITLMISANVTL